MTDKFKIMENDGSLVCMEKNCGPKLFYWCNHLTEIIRTHRDAPVYWKILDRRKSTGEPSLSVKIPMIPTRKMFAIALISTSRRDPDIWELWLQSSDLAKTIRRPKDILLGIVGPGEGLFIWRSMVNDYFQANVETVNLKCQNRSHSYSNQLNLARDIAKDPGDPVQVAQVFSIWYHGQCIDCVTDTTIESFDEDLVPDRLYAKGWKRMYGGDH